MKVVEFLSDKRDKYVVVPEYSKEYFLKQNFLVLPKNIILKKIVLFIYIKFLRKLNLIYFLIKKCKFIFQNPLQKTIVVLDKSSSREVIKVLGDRKLIILPTRFEDFNEIYISGKIISAFIKNFFKMSFKINYLSCLIQIINPKIIITGIDTSNDFFRISKIFHKKGVKTVIIQNSHKLNGELSKEFHADYYYTYGEFEKTELKDYLINTKTEATGSLRASIAKKYLISKKVQFKKKFDICLISEPHLMLNTDGFLNTNQAHEYIAMMTDYTLLFCKKHNKKMIFSGKADLDKIGDKDAEIIFYKNILKEKNFQIKFGKRKEFCTYKNIAQSELIIGLTSSCLRESFAFDRKVLCCDVANTIDTRFPGSGVHILNKNSYYDFEERVLMLLDMSYDNYLSNIKNLNHIYNKEVDTFETLQKRLQP